MQAERNQEGLDDVGVDVGQAIYIRAPSRLRSSASNAMLAGIDAVAAFTPLIMYTKPQLHQR